MKRFTLIVAAFALGAASIAAAQLPVQPAERVRILTRDGTSLTGVVIEQSADSIQVRGSTNDQWVRQGDIAYLERSAQRYRRFGRNFAITMASTAGISGAISAITWTKCVSAELFGCLLHPETRADAFAFGAVAGGVLSVPLGLILGLAIQYDRWEPVQTPTGSRSSLTVRPVFDRGLGVSAAFSF